MSQTPHEDFDLRDVLGVEGVGTDDDPLPESHFVDGSGPLFTMYAEMAGEEDKKMADSWKADADGILVFTGLFSAAVAALVAVSIQDLKSNSQDVSAFYLANIYQLLANANQSHISIPSTLSNPSFTFSPPKQAIWVNSLWFLSLAISLTCALLATLLQQWARRYIRVTQPRYNPHKRARLRAFFAEGVDNLYLPWVVEALPTLVHVSLFLFFSGLLVFLSNIHHTVFSVVVWWIGLCLGAYICITFMPIFRHDSPYYAPLSTSAWFLYTGILYAVFRILGWFSRHGYIGHATHRQFNVWKNKYRSWFIQGIEKIVEESVWKQPSDIDSRALMWTFDTLDEDHELERFFAGIPGLRDSTVVNSPLDIFFRPYGKKLSDTLIGFMGRTLSSNLVSESVKQQRTVIFSKAMDAASLAIDMQILERVLYGDMDGMLNSVEFGLYLMNVDHSDHLTSYFSESVVSIIIASSKVYNDTWFELATDQLGISKSVLQVYLAHGDSMLLANCICWCRKTIHAYSTYGWYRNLNARSRTLESITTLDAQHILPALQHDFCALWNETVLSAKNPEHQFIRSISIDVLRHIRNIYVALHRGTNVAPTAFSAATPNDDPVLLSPLSYPLCNIKNHHHVAPSLTPEVVTNSVKEANPSIPPHDIIATMTLPRTTVDAPLSSASAAPNAAILEIHPPPAAVLPVRMRSASSSAAVPRSTHAAEPQSFTAPPSHNRSGSLKLSPTPTTVLQVFSSSVTTGVYCNFFIYPRNFKAQAFPALTEVPHPHRPAPSVSDSAPDSAPLFPTTSGF
ncbi:hypothetical protein BJV78DRAFT_1279643 [Lactifluus subvellereus]|nr:hypothetical protein BJV78DRAFT_1279643 [Lactifluus subvellereus]